MSRGTLTRGLLDAVLAEAGIAVAPEASEKLLDHAREMLLWNRSIRLTAITDPCEVAVKHVADSLLLLRFAPFPGVTMDFGSGAGYPGIPLAVALPGSRFCLVESSQKKCAFLSRVRSILSLGNVEIVPARLGVDAGPRIGPFDRIVTRATLPAPAALEILLPRLAPGGTLLLMTGPGERRAPAPARGTPPPRAAEVRRERFSLPRGMGERTIVEYAPA